MLAAAKTATILQLLFKYLQLFLRSYFVAAAITASTLFLSTYFMTAAMTASTLKLYILNIATDIQAAINTNEHKLLYLKATLWSLPP